ncbi:MAG: radical SAM protein [Pseudomonadota bacterium]
MAFVSLSPAPDGDELGPLELPSYGVHRIIAAANALKDEMDLDVRFFDYGKLGRVGTTRALEEFAPDLIGFSIYVWSTAKLVALARSIKAKRPETFIIFGGPSARSSVFDLAPYAGAHTYLDAVAEGDGEVLIQRIICAPDRSPAALKKIGGLALPNPDGTWAKTGPAPSCAMDDIASPYQQGLMPQGAVAYLETYRGCPLACRFCEWGAVRPARDVFSEDYIAREIDAFEELEAPAVFLLDAGLNLNAQAFRNLSAANKRTQHLKNTLFWAEIYPSTIRPKHLEFLEDIGSAYLGIGLQSQDQAVLDAHDRKIDQTRFEPSVRDLATVAPNIEIQIIFGLPGETPEGFLRTLDFALSMPGGVRAYHCLVLPDALLTRSRPEWDVKFDPVTMAMTSNSDWSEQDIRKMRAHLDRLAAQHNGSSGTYWWSFK